MPNTSCAKLHDDIYAVIDLGSNSFHMLMVREVAGSVQVLGRVKRKVKLASGLDENNVLSAKAMARGWECLALFAERLQDIPRANITIVGTATLRLATNVDVFIDKARQILGHPLNIISGEKEASTIYLGVAHTSANPHHSLVVDIGGASTEIIIGEGFETHKVTSLNMGCVTYLAKHFPNGQLTQVNFDSAIAAAQQVVDEIASDYKTIGWQCVLGASGTVQALQEILICQGLDEVITLSRLESIMAQAIKCGDLDHLDIKGLLLERRHVFPSGIAILIAIFRTLEISGMTLSGGALREGLLYSMIPSQQQQDVRKRTLDSLMIRYHVDREQGERVAELATHIARQIKDNWQLNQFEGVEILKAAALLHETGLLIEYKKYPKHGAYIISNSDLPGFSFAQKKLLTALIHNQKGDVSQEEIHKQTTTSVLLAQRLTRILRVAVILSMRRKDEALPSFSVDVTNDNQLTIKFPEGWLASHPLMRAELSQEESYQSQQDWPLSIS